MQNPTPGGREPQWHPRPVSGGCKRSGADAHRTGRPYQVPGRTTRDQWHCGSPLGLGIPLAAMPRLLRAGTLLLGALLLVAACGSGQAASFDPTGPCTTDGRAPGAYPDLEALVAERGR